MLVRVNHYTLLYMIVNFQNDAHC